MEWLSDLVGSPKIAVIEAVFGAAFFIVGLWRKRDYLYVSAAVILPGVFYGIFITRCLMSKRPCITI